MLHKLSHLIIIFLLFNLTAPLVDSVNAQQEKPTGIGQSAKPKPAQEPAEDQEEAVRLTSKLVVVPVSVSDANGEPVKDLKVDDIIIEEEGRPQKVVALGEPGKTPVEIAMLFDVSGSVQGKFAFEQQAAVQFVKEVLKPSDAVSVFSIGVTPKIMKTRTTSGDDAVNGIMAIAPLKEPTAFFDAVVDAAHYLDKTAEPGSRRVVVVISDGEENYSQRSSLNDALKELQKNDCLFYAINPSGGGIKLNVISTKGQGFMEAMAAQTGGKAFNLARVEDLEAVFRQITAELQAQYLFGYYSSDERTEAGFRRITVRAPRRSDLRIRARQGYYVTKS